MRNCNYYTNEEDKLFSSLVIRFNYLNDEDEEKKRLRTRIYDRTQILLYQLPLRNLYLTEDEASDIYLELRLNIDKIISSYKICNVTYNTYLIQICKYKARSIIRSTYKKEQFEDEYLNTLQFEYEDSQIEVLEREPFYGDIHPRIFDLDMKGLIEYIANTRDSNDNLGLTSDEKELHEAMLIKKNRKYFMILLLTLPQFEEIIFIDRISRIMQLDSMVFSYFYSLRFELLNESNQKWRAAQETANRHYKTLLTIRTKLNYEIEEDKINDLNKTYERIYKHYIDKLAIARRKKRGLTQTETAKILGLTRSTICYAIKEVKMIIMDILGITDEL